MWVCVNLYVYTRICEFVFIDFKYTYIYIYMCVCVCVCVFAQSKNVLLGNDEKIWLSTCKIMLVYVRL